MSTKTELLKLLDENCGEFLSGQKIGETLGISRAAVNKAATALKKSGYKILSRTNQGYKLLEHADILSEAAIGALIRTPCRLKVFDEIGSTNDYAKGMDVEKGPVAVVANKQTKGRGRMGRTFSSPSGTGIYLSVAFKPDFDMDKSQHVTIATAIAVCHAIEKVCGVSPKIKWVNDLFYRNKKICGILTEAQTNLEIGRIDSLTIGVGINCFPGSFPPELMDIAGSISDAQDDFSRSALAAEVINNILEMLENFSSKSYLPEYRRRCFILGKNISVHPLSGGKPIRARAIDIDETGGLVVEYMEGVHMREMATLTTGEVSVREF